VDLEQFIESYYQCLYQNPTGKDDAVALDVAVSVPASQELCIIVSRLDDAAWDPFEIFAIVKCLFAIDAHKSLPGEFFDRFVRWVKVCVYVGAYKDCIRLVEWLQESTLWNYTGKGSDRVQSFYT